MRWETHESGGDQPAFHSRPFLSCGSNGGMFTWEPGQNPASASVFRTIAPLIMNFFAAHFHQAQPG